MNFTPLINDTGPAGQMPAGIPAEMPGNLSQQPGKPAFKTLLKRAGDRRENSASVPVRTLDTKTEAIPGHVPASGIQKTILQILGILSKVTGSVTCQRDLSLDKDLISKLKELLRTGRQAETNPDLLALLSALTEMQQGAGMGANRFSLKPGEGTLNDIQGLLEDISRAFLNRAGAWNKGHLPLKGKHTRLNPKKQTGAARDKMATLADQRINGANIHQTGGGKIKPKDGVGASSIAASMEQTSKAGSMHADSPDNPREGQISDLFGIRTASKKPDMTHPDPRGKKTPDGQSRQVTRINGKTHQEGAATQTQQNEKGGGLQATSAVAEQLNTRTPNNFATVLAGDKTARGTDKRVTAKNPGTEDKNAYSRSGSPLASTEIKTTGKNNPSGKAGSVASADVDSRHAGQPVHSGNGEAYTLGSMGVAPSDARDNLTVEKLHENNILRTEVISQLKQAMLGAMNMNRNRTVLQLHPPELGSIRIEITVHQQGEIHASFVAGTQEVKHLIQAGLGDLREQLSNNGFHLGSCNVDVSGQGAEHQAQRNWGDPNLPHQWNQASQQDEVAQSSRPVPELKHEAGVHIVV